MIFIYKNALHNLIKKTNEYLNKMHLAVGSLSATILTGNMLAAAISLVSISSFIMSSSVVSL